MIPSSRDHKYGGKNAVPDTMVMKTFSWRLRDAGQRQDNLNAKQPHSQDKRGFRFFQDDEDEFGLEDILQAICFLQVALCPGSKEYAK